MGDLARYASCDAGQGKLDEVLVDKNFPIFLTRYGPALWPVTDPAAGPPVIVLSVPKSGSFFTEALYKRMGYHGVWVHVMDGFCNDRRFEEWLGFKTIPVTALAPLVLPGQIIVSHCSRQPANAAALSGFKKIYLYRDLREVLVSHTRADGEDLIPAHEMPARVADFCRDRGEGLKSVIAAVSSWRNHPDVLAIDFADLTAANPCRQDALAARFEAFMGWPKALVIAALRAVPDDDTPTKTEGTRSTVAGAWDESSEAWFKQHMAGIEVAPDRVLGGRSTK
jgi:hypothetical protein